jgi:CRP/FNR family transcriptional regulator
MAVDKLEPDDLQKLGASCVEVDFKKGDIIFKQNALSSNVIYIREGLVKVHIEGPEREQILKIAKGPTYLGIPTTFGDKVNHYSASAITPTSVCFIDINVFKEFITQNGQFAYEIILELCKNELQHFSRCVNLVQKQIHGRLAGTLLFFADSIFNSNSFEMPFNQSEMADLIYTSRETVSRLLSELNKENIIEMKGRKIKLVDIEKLKEISKKG